MRTETAAQKTANGEAAQNQINIPIELNNWRDLPEGQQKRLLWFHQHVLNNHLRFRDAKDAIGYDETTIFKVLKGTYTGGSYANVCKAIQRYQSIHERRGTIQVNTTIDNSITKLIGAGLDYALANNSITTIIGDARMGKTVGAQKWNDEDNNGSSVYVVAPPWGGPKMLVHRIAEAVGVDTDASMPVMYEGVMRSFNQNRLLIVDEGHRLLPKGRKGNATSLEIIRDFHDMTGCALGILSTHRFDEALRGSVYMYGQILGRIGMPILLPKKIKQADWLPILKQYVAKPSARLLAECERMANGIGRLGILAQTLKVASRMAHKSKHDVGEIDVIKAVALRRQMSGQDLTQ